MLLSVCTRCGSEALVCASGAAAVIGAYIVSCLIGAIRCLHTLPPAPLPTCLQLKQHAMYVVVHMASSTSAHKEAVMASGWPAQLVQLLRCAEWRGRWQVALRLHACAAW